MRDLRHLKNNTPVNTEVLWGGGLWWGITGRPWRRTSRRMRHPCVAVLVLSLVNANGFPEDEDANAH